jgi:hypothetical protein
MTDNGVSAIKPSSGQEGAIRSGYPFVPKGFPVTGTNRVAQAYGHVVNSGKHLTNMVGKLATNRAIMFCKHG